MEEGLFELMSEADTAASGILNDRNVHGVYKLIAQLSSTKNAKNHTLFDPEITRTDLPQMDRELLVRILQKLLKEKAVINIPYMEHSGGTEMFTVHSAFITNPADNRTAESLYLDLLDHSAGVISIYLSNKGIPEKEKLRKVLHGETFLSSIFLNPEEITAGYSFPVPFHPELLKRFSKDISEKLNAKAVTVPGSGLISAKSESILFFFETAADFLEEELLPALCHDPDCIKRIRQTEIEETVYYMEPGARQTSSFVSQRSAALRECLEKPDTPRSLKAAAERTLNLIDSLSGRAESVYEEQARAGIESQALQFRSSVLDHNGDWHQAVRFLSHSEVLKMNQNVWDLIRSDTALFYSVWERPGGRMHIFTPAAYDVFWMIIPGMLAEIQGSDWKIVAIKNHIEIHEAAIRPLFANRDFVPLYGRLLRRAYIEYMPWLFRFLLSIRFPFLHDLFFKSAKDKIKQEQILFGRKNDLRLKSILTELQEKKSARLTRMIEQTFYNSVIAQLDDWYFHKKMIPLIIDIDSALPELESDQLNRIIKKYNFNTVPMAGSGRPELSVMMYPSDQDWRSRLNKIKKLVMILLEQDKRQPDSEKKENSGYNYGQTDRAKRIFTYLQRKSEYQTSSGRKTSQEDPYDILSKQIDKGLEPEKKD